MAVLKEHDPGTGTWKPVVLGKQGPQGNQGDPGIDGAPGAKGDTGE